MITQRRIEAVLREAEERLAAMRGEWRQEEQEQANRYVNIAIDADLEEERWA